MFKFKLTIVFLFFSLHQFTPAIASDKFAQISYILQERANENRKIVREERRKFYKKDYTSNFNDYLNKAKAGDPNAQYHLAHMYQRSKEIEYNPKEAARWFEEAAINGHANAAKQLGDLYEGGHGVEKNSQKAFEFFQLSAELGDAEGQWMVAYYILRELAVEKNADKAIEWLLESEKQNNDMARQMLGDIYLRGALTKRDDLKGERWFLKHVALGNMRALLDMAVIYYEHFKKENNIEDGERAYYYFKILKLLSEHSNDDISYKNSVALIESLEKQLPAESIREQDELVEAWPKIASEQLGLSSN